MAKPAFSPKNRRDCRLFKRPVGDLPFREIPTEFKRCPHCRSNVDGKTIANEVRSQLLPRVIEGIRAARGYLSSEVEGLDLAILKTFDSKKYKPKIICTETLVTTTMKLKEEAFAFLESQGYMVRGQTFPNSIFVLKELYK